MGVIGCLLTLLTIGAQHPSALEAKLARAGLVDLQTIDSTLCIRLMYAREDNFTGRVLYTHLTRAWLLPEAAHALARAQQLLRREHPGYTLVVFDATRPMSVQARMWKAVEGTQKAIYVSNPAHGGGLHNYGLAVDISIAKVGGDTIPMGTKVDYLGRAAHITDEEVRLKRGTLTPEAVRNRRLLRRVMRQAGFKTLPTEWWHFNYKTRSELRKGGYKPIP